MKIKTRIFIVLLTMALAAFAIGEYAPFPITPKLVVVVAIAIAIAQALSQTITKPLQTLTDWTQERSQHSDEAFARSECSTLTALIHRQPDEIGELGQAIQQREVEFERSLDRLRQTTAAKERMESELQIAREIQMNMLITGCTPCYKHKDLAIYTALQPAREVGGDFYDLYFRRENLSYLFEENRFCFCVGDASGKGVPAALFMAVVKTLLKSQAYIDLSPAKIVTHVNDVISADNPSCMFVTLFFGVLNLADGELVYTNAGHNPPYIHRHDGTVEPLNQRHGAAVGVLDGLVYREDKTTLTSGDILIAYTDGVTEAMDGEKNLFSDQRFLDLLKSGKYRSAEEVINLTIAAIAEFQGDAEQADDLTMIAIQFLKQSLPEASLDLAINSEALSSLREQWR